MLIGAKHVQLWLNKTCWWTEGAKKSSDLCLWFDEDLMKNVFRAILLF